MIVFLFIPHLFAEDFHTKILGQTVSNSDNALSLWVNPANMMFRNTPARDIYTYSNETSKSLTYATTAGSLGFGLQYKSIDGQTFWTTNTGLSMKLDKHLNLGFSYKWNAPSEMDNFSTFAISSGWRPFSWLGFGAKIDNIGAPLKTLNIEQLAYFGGTLNIFDGRFQMSSQIQTPSNLLFETYDFEHQAQLNLGHFQLEIFKNPDIQIGLGLSYLFGEEYVHAQGTDNQNYALHLSKSSKKKHLAHQKPIAYIKLRSSYPYTSPPPSLLSSSTEPTYFQLISVLRQVAEDNDIHGIFVHIEDMPFSTAQIQEIQEIIQLAKTKGKMIVSYLDTSTDTKSYLLASSSDRIFMHPAADLNIQGISSERMFFKDTLEWVGIQPQYVKRSEYKSAPEQYTESHSSPPATEQSKELLESIYNHTITTISKSRSLTNEAIKEIFKNGPHSAQVSLEKGLVDGLFYHDEIQGELEDIFGKQAELTKARSYPRKSDGWGRENSIAIIPITGAIMSGTSQTSGLLSSNTAGSETIVAQINEARKNDNIKAVVLRVDSPGGSAFASDEIWRAVEKLKEEKKPVITSMGGIAASGGYYVASNSTKIFAEETTITGSIGVYSGKFSMSELLRTLHIHTERLNIGTEGSLYSTIYPWSNEQEQKMEEMVEETYERFKDRVSKGRSLDGEQVELIARGRVWSGEKAKEVGLIDEFGSLYDAIAEAEKLVDSKDLNLVIMRGGSAQSSPGIVPFQNAMEHSEFTNIDERFTTKTSKYDDIKYPIYLESDHLKIPLPNLHQTTPTTSSLQKVETDVQIFKNLQQDHIWMIEPNTFLWMQ